MILYAYVVAEAKKGTNKGMFRIPLTDLPESSYFGWNQGIKKGSKNYEAILKKVAGLIDTSVSNTEIVDSIEIGNSEYEPTWRKHYNKKWWK